jgi:hypothetical protein
MVWAAISWYSVGSITTIHGQITAREYVDRLGIQVHPMIQMLFLNINALKDMAGTLQSWFKEHEGELQHLPWPAQSLWPVLETTVKNKFPPPTSLK